jgi:hypothetical protein
MKSSRELRAFIREVLNESRIYESVKPEEIKIGTKLSDKAGGTPVAVIVGFMHDAPSGADIARMARSASGISMTPIAKVYSQAAGNKQFEMQILPGQRPTKTTTYNYDPSKNGVGRYLTVEEAKNSVFRYDINTPEGNWLATFLSAVGNLPASFEIDTQNLAYALNVMDITREEMLDGSVSTGTFFNASQLFVPDLDELYTPQFRYTQSASEDKSTACLLTQDEFLSKLPEYVAYLSGEFTGGYASSLSKTDVARMSMCTQETTQGFMYKVGTGIIAGIGQRFGIPFGATYGVSQILPALGPMAYHAKNKNYAAFTAYIFQITADIVASVSGGLSSPREVAPIVADIVCSYLLITASDPSFSAQVKSLISQKDPDSLEDVLRISRELKSSDTLDPQDLKSLVPSL